MFFNLPRGGRAQSKEYVAWIKAATPLAVRAWRDAGKPNIAQPYAVTISLGMNRRGDIANREKPLMDLLVKAIDGLPDDRWIDEMTITRAPLVDNLATVTIRTLALL